ncbi:MAG: AbrB/MazE/SpoVT family DNA-binding domain-containing protein [Proteobacteria bacterium]|nr:AbrB/MazE/SpoVT family DNA-binding domain-containing protein [Pseudomonadota bacterium]
MNKDIINVTSEGRLTLPEKIRNVLNIGKGSKLIVTMEKKYILLKPMTSLSELYGIDREIWKRRDVKKDVLELREEWDKGFRDRVEP